MANPPLEQLESIAKAFATVMIAFPLILAFLALFWIGTLTVHLASPVEGDKDRLTWTIVLVLLNWIGAILYWITWSSRMKRIRRDMSGNSADALIAPDHSLITSERSKASEPTPEEILDRIDPGWRYKPAANRERALRSVRSSPR